MSVKYIRAHIILVRRASGRLKSRAFSFNRARITKALELILNQSLAYIWKHSRINWDMDAQLEHWSDILLSDVDWSTDGSAHVTKNWKKDTLKAWLQHDDRYLQRNTRIRVKVSQIPELLSLRDDWHRLPVLSILKEFSLIIACEGSDGRPPAFVQRAFATIEKNRKRRPFKAHYSVTKARGTLSRLLLERRYVFLHDGDLWLSKHDLECFTYHEFGGW